MELLAHAPFDFIVKHKAKNLDEMEYFVHRTFNLEDFNYFLQALQHIYLNYGGLELLFSKHASKTSTPLMPFSL